MPRTTVPGLMAFLFMAALSGRAEASLVWDWEYAGPGIAASGTFLTVDVPDGSGFYSIISITGFRNGEAITGLQPAGTAIPGNEPYAVDNLVSESGPHLTGNGFGFSTSGGHYANPFWADFLTPPGALEFSSNPSSGATSELPILFRASIVRPPSVPEPATWVGMAAGLLGWAIRRRHGRVV